jgi:hypothetical protein
MADCVAACICPAGAYYLVERGSCSFVDKYTAVLAAGGAGMILFDDQAGDSRCIDYSDSRTAREHPAPAAAAAAMASVNPIFVTRFARQASCRM